ncbi:low-specificity L-threonine aldolase [Geobacter sp.]|uniref:low-specificity L-threonine aldolase n=1 Tax=Geobacter sp. TaxID=46610 RepID=UPI00260D6C86|nr:low-specificity L-threonine aldolase [Geobacter sp.]
MKIIDLRSDTVTRPTPAMRAAMAEAPVGDDVYGEDPTVNRLEAMGAEMLGTEAALFAASGTQTNLLALLSHCGRGDEYIAGQTAHCYRYEGGGAAVLGGIQPQPLDFEPDGTLDLEKVARAIKPPDPHFARTRLLCLENTTAGKVLPLAYLGRASAFARERGLALHLDGARVFNAAVRLGVEVREISRHFDTVSVCLSKGLGAPVGSLLCGNRELIGAARRWRKVLGGGMRQAGVLAAAGIVALTSHVARLAEDHAHARLLAEGLASIPGLSLDPAQVQTNMVFVSPEPDVAGPLVTFLRERGILIAGRESIRLVTHLDVTASDIERTVAAFREFFARA